MKKPALDAPLRLWSQYRAWVREQLRNWHPSDDKARPDLYVPRFNGVRGDADDSDE
jgi:hypothetical protein